MVTIQRIRVKNFRSLVDETIELSDYNFFVGKNDSGKSNVLKALNLFLLSSLLPVYSICFIHQVSHWCTSGSSPLQKKVFFQQYL